MSDSEKHDIAWGTTALGDGIVTRGGRSVRKDHLLEQRRKILNTKIIS